MYWIIKYVWVLSNLSVIKYAWASHCVPLSQANLDPAVTLPASCGLGLAKWRAGAAGAECHTVCALCCRALGMEGWRWGERLWFPALWMLSSCLYAGIQSLPSAYRRSSGQMKRTRWWLTDLSPKIPSPTLTTPCLFTLSQRLFSIFRPGPGLGGPPYCWLPYSQTRNVTYHFAFLHPPA